MKISIVPIIISYDEFKLAPDKPARIIIKTFEDAVKVNLGDKAALESLRKELICLKAVVENAQTQLRLSGRYESPTPPQRTETKRKWTIINGEKVYEDC